MPRPTAYIAGPRIPLDTIEDRAIRQHNAGVVGATYLPPRPVRCAPGMGTFVDLPPSYRNVFFGADREYADNEGWQTVHGTGTGGPRYQRKNRKQRKWREVENPLVAKEGTDSSAPRLRYKEVPTKGAKGRK